MRSAERVSTVAGAGVVRGIGRRRSRRTRDNLVGWAFVAPAVFGFLVFTLYPVVGGLVLGFLQWDMLTAPKWIGLANYTALFQDSVFLISLRNTVLWVVYYVPASIVLSLGLAMVLNQPLRGISFFRVCFYIPVISPLLAVALLFVWLYNPDYGLINWVLSWVGIPPVPWLADARIALPSIAIMAIWKNAGYNMLIFLAALQGIPRQLYEAATIDGANAVRRFWHITVPLLAPATFFIVVTSLIGAFQVFGEVYVMTGGGPSNSTSTLSFYLYQNAFRYNKMGYAGAIAVVMFGLMLLVTLVWFRLYGRQVYYER